MENKRKKSRTAIHKNVEETRQKLREMEEELSILTQERYPFVGEAFANAFIDCPDFDLIKMTDAKIRQFMRHLYRLYRMDSERQSEYTYPDVSNEIYPNPTLEP